MNEDVIPKEILHHFKSPKVNFMVSKFEQYLLNDLYQYDTENLQKLNRNVTNDLIQEIKDYVSQKRNIRYSAVGETRSNVGSTAVLTADYENKRLDCIKVGDEVLSLNMDTKKIEVKEVAEVYINGEKDVYEITLEGGKKIASSELHKFLVTRRLSLGYYNPIKKNGKKIGKKYTKAKYTTPKWTQVKDFKVGDFMAVPKNISTEKSCNIPLNELKLIGFWLADGYYHKFERVVFDLSKQNKIDYLKKIEEKSQENYMFRRRDNGRDIINHIGWNKGYKFCATKKLDCRQVKEKDYISKIIEELDLSDKHCYDKFIPNKIKMGTRKEVIALLSGLFVGDGWTDKTKGLSYNTTSIKLWEDIKICLTKIGIDYNESLKKVQKSKHSQSYEVHIVKKSDLQIVLNEFDLDEYKIEEIQKIILSRKYDVKTCVELGGDIVYKKIKKIEYKGKQKVYDIQVKDNHNYIANLIVSSNSGKSLSMLVIVNLYCKLTGLDFNKKIDYIVCGNQVEYREKLKNAKFGDFFLIDENFFAKSGIGANLEAQQLKDYNNTIAKQNIGNIFITPEEFLNVGAVLGFSTYGRDNNNWLSRLLVYKFKNRQPYLVGFIVLDVGRLFLEHKCFLFKFIGGCNATNMMINQEWIGIDKIPKDLIKFSTCIKDADMEEVVKVRNGCPFYKYCEHPLARYEKKKDSWIEKSMTGTIDNRTKERFRLALNLAFELIGEVDEERGVIKYNCRSAKDMKNIVRIRLHKFTNTKLGIAEFDELLQIIISNSNIEFLTENLHVVEDEEIRDKFFNHEEYGGLFRNAYDNYVENLPKDETDEEVTTKT